MSGPDFLCIGMQKSGTQWLFDQLQHHPQVWMPPVKELHYFDRPFPHENIKALAASWAADPVETNRMRHKKRARPMDPRDDQFFLRALACEGLPADIGTYGSLFEPKATLLSGDVTPAYSILEEDVVRALASRLPTLRVLLLARDPVERLWSQMMMEVSKGQLSATDTQAVEPVARFLGEERVRRRSFPSRTAALWSRWFGDRFSVVLFDDIAREPEMARDRALIHLGVDPHLPSGALSPGFNRKSRPKPVSRPDAVTRYLEREFALERRACAAMFGGAAHGWAESDEKLQ